MPTHKKHTAISLAKNFDPFFQLLYKALIWSAKKFDLQPCCTCATLNLNIQALKLYIYFNINIYLKDAILALSQGAQN